MREHFEAMQGIARAQAEAHRQDAIAALEVAAREQARREQLERMAQQVLQTSHVDPDVVAAARYARRPQQPPTLPDLNHAIQSATAQYMAQHAEQLGRVAADVGRSVESLRQEVGEVVRRREDEDLERQTKRQNQTQLAEAQAAGVTTQPPQTLPESSAAAFFDIATPRVRVESEPPAKNRRKDKAPKDAGMSSAAKPRSRSEEEVPQLQPIKERRRRSPSEKEEVPAPKPALKDRSASKEREVVPVPQPAIEDRRGRSRARSKSREVVPVPQLAIEDRRRGQTESPERVPQFKPRSRSRAVSEDIEVVPVLYGPRAPRRNLGDPRPNSADTEVVPTRQAYGCGECNFRVRGCPRCRAKGFEANAMERRALAARQRYKSRPAFLRFMGLQPQRARKLVVLPAERSTSAPKSQLRNQIAERAERGTLIERVAVA